MSKRITKHTLDERLEAVLNVMEGNCSIKKMAKQLGVAPETVKRWIAKYKGDGVAGLTESKTWKRYSPQLKRKAVEYYLKEAMGVQKTCEKFNISSSSVLRKWIKLYTSGKGFKPTSKRWNNQMNKGRKTTWKERIEIVQFTIANNLDYHKAETVYHVSYQQVYGWVRKYKANGPEALRDRRGHTLKSKPKDSLTEEENYKLRIKELEERNQYLEAENGLIKKLKEIERRNRPV